MTEEKASFMLLKVRLQEDLSFLGECQCTLTNIFCRNWRVMEIFLYFLRVLCKQGKITAK